MVDDKPLPLATFLTLLTRATGTPPPRQVPAWLVRIAAPVIAAMGPAELVLSNAKAKRELAWSLHYPTVEAGLTEFRPRSVDAA